MLLITVYVFFAFFCIALIQKKIAIDPLIIVIPCVLIVPQSLAGLVDLYISLLPACAVLALLEVIFRRNDLQIESVTRFAAGTGLGAFLAIQVLAFSLNVQYLLGMLLLASIASVAALIGFINLTGWYRSSMSLMMGLGVGVVHFVFLTSGRAILPAKNPGSTAVIWLVSIIGALVGVFALPVGNEFSISLAVLGASLLAVVLGTLISRSLNLNTHQFESKVLSVVVLVMMFSIWVHVCIKYYWLT